MLQELCKNHQTWIGIAYKLCKNDDLCKDIVQDMYLKLHDCKKEISIGYIYMTIKSIWLDGLRKNRIDIDIEIKDIPIDDFNIDDFMTKEHQHEIIDFNISLLQWHEQKIIHLSNQIGIRPLAREAGISKEIIVKTRNKLKWQSQNQIASHAIDRKKK